MDNMPSTSPIEQAPAAIPSGLSNEQAAGRLAETGPNEVAAASERPWRRVLHHFWSPVPCMLEATIVLQLFAGEWIEAGMVGALLLINIVLGLVQEGRANATLALLRRRLAPRARVRREGVWLDVAAAMLVPGDIVQLSLGGIVPADARLVSGSVLLGRAGPGGCGDPGNGKPAGRGCIDRSPFYAVRSRGQDG